MKIISGYRAQPHVESQEWRDGNIAIYGTGTYILNIGSKLAATVVSANEITIADGMVIAQGCTAEVNRGTTESIAVDNGEQNLLRKDLIVLRYTRDASTNVEDMQLGIIKGTPATSNPSVPSYTSGSIADGDTLVEFPLYTVNISGITIQSVTRLVDYVTIPTKAYVDAAKTALQNSINTVSNTLATVSNRVGTVALNTTAKNALAAINELLSRINTLTSNLATTNSNVTAANNRINTANSNITAVANRATALENKTAGFSGTILLSVPNGEINYRRLNSLSTYLVIVSTVAGVDSMKGIYIVGVPSNNAIGIKTVSNASSVVLSDAGNLLLGIRNNGVAYIRVTIITLYGTAL